MTVWFAPAGVSSSLSAAAAAVKDETPDARSLYLRARAKELAGQPEAAHADYNMASRTAFATGGAASGEAHLYRGILFYRRSDFAHAEDEGSSHEVAVIPMFPGDLVDFHAARDQLFPTHGRVNK